MNTITSPLTRDRLIALAEGLRQRLLMGLAFLAELFDGTPLGATLRVWVRWHLAELEFRMRMRLFILARLDAPPVRRRTCPELPPFRAPVGVRRHIQRGSALRHITRGLFPRLSIEKRIMRLRRLMQNPERAVAKIRARLMRGLINGRLLLRFAQRCVVRALAAPATMAADTS